MVSKVREIIKTHTEDESDKDSQEKPLFTPKKRIMMTGSRFQPMEKVGECNCRKVFGCLNDDSSVDGNARINLAKWEGSAVLSHGAVIQFGCHKFVFSIVDVDAAGTPSLDNATAKSEK